MRRCIKKVENHGYNTFVAGSKQGVSTQSMSYYATHEILWKITS